MSNADRLQQLIDLSGELATKADDLRLKMSALGEAGNVWAQMLDGIIAQVQEGLLSKIDAVNAFGDGLIVIDGQLRSVRDVLTEVLPTMGEVQAKNREMVEEIKADGVSLEELIARLGEQHNVAARQLGELLRLLKAGKVTIQEVIRYAQELDRQFPGSEGAALAELFLEGIRDGSLT